MKKKLTLIILHLICAAKLFAQHDAVREAIDRATDSIQTEGKALYRSEWASWYGTDVFLEKCPAKKALSGGYFSYETSDQLVNIFFSNGDSPKVIATISFGKDFNQDNYKLDTAERNLTNIERDYYNIRTVAFKRAISDTSFKHYKNTGLNVVPLIQKDVKKAYILTSPKANGIVIFGNDYLINFNNVNEITRIKSLHKNIIYTQAKADTGSAITTAYHTHLKESGDFMSATDICTLMLYEKLTTWKQHYVISKNDISIWDCDKNELVILTMEAWNKINADKKSRHPDKQ
ncbi:hypothetical protein [Mucilaginibacter sp.]|uniref:hypothetical protein n=1 Tax=Mucilaginibacter sp. TaxID=1882438 RepID=UPI0025F72EB7|nr:hypothetical protein [Mucilaginibacter sp.]